MLCNSAPSTSYKRKSNVWQDPKYINPGSRGRESSHVVLGPDVLLRCCFKANWKLILELSFGNVLEIRIGKRNEGNKYIQSMERRWQLWSASWFVYNCLSFDSPRSINFYCSQYRKLECAVHSCSSCLSELYIFFFFICQ